MLARDLSQFAPDPNQGLTVPIEFLNDLNGSVTRDEVLGTYSLWCKQLVGADRCSVALADAGDTLNVTALTGSRGYPEGTRHPIDGTVIGDVYTREEMIYVPDIAQIDKPDARYVLNLGYTAAVLAPIKTGTACFGALAASFVTPIANPEDVMAMMSALGRCLATQLVVVNRLETLSRVARTDHLTKALNRRSLRERADLTWAHWIDSGEQFVFISADLDHFKSINDTFGHTAGDAVLREAARRMIETCGPRGTLFRIGGEEFGILLPTTTQKAAVTLAEDVRLALCETPVPVGSQAIPVTASFGVARSALEDRTFNDVLKRADKALYEAKSSGRNRVIVAPTP